MTSTTPHGRSIQGKKAPLLLVLKAMNVKKLIAALASVFPAEDMRQLVRHILGPSIHIGGHRCHAVVSGLHYSVSGDYG